MKFSSKITFLASLAGWSSAAILEADIDAGTIRGGMCDVGNSTQFLGIPYAIPPEGELRWQAPQKFNGTYQGGTLQATRARPICYQFGDATADRPPYSEDCLFLNIWVPPNASNTTADLPVKVWIHGGGNTGGSINNPFYNGCDLADDGTIVVNVAYRLGILGFLALESAGIAGNFGISDILLALQWVQDNIAKFGGDKSKVLLFGESAGAWDTWIVSSLPQAPSLMRAAAMHSGGGRLWPSNATAQDAGAQFAAVANCTGPDAGECLRSIHPERLNRLSSRPGSPPLSSFGITIDAITPYIDGNVIPEQPITAGAQVPAMFTSTATEGKFFLFLTNPNALNLTDAEFDGFLTGELGRLGAQVSALYPASEFASFPNPGFERASQILTDYVMKCTSYYGLMKSAEKGIPGWTYIFDHIASCPISDAITAPIAQILGPTHGFDVPYLFGHTDRFPRPNGTCSYNDQERQSVNILVNGLTALAATGNASTSDFNWPTFTNGSYEGLYIGQNSTEIMSLTEDFSKCEFWSQVYDIVLTASETNGTNVTDEIPPDATISATSLPTETQPSKGFKTFEAVGNFSIVIAVVVGYILMKVV
ncbi:hypothetical protein H072_5430 [Dactylellina haptotyla CBS 200.50]|uniref:Carboxylic ester hydrolase n=1 Tax=Dactylellina haptotyla (strain CBS 200.50) TaxID=1284197 RepID=S8BZ76_DACHA|nr:hypothetical protein H072_5430 [Dactylellina haptotyla CBS 200.50]